MLDRIKLILKEEGLKSSSFADYIQVSRGTISHILNGRNDPSKDTIDKILNNFPNISPSWFLSGEGSMYITEPGISKHISYSSPTQPDLFSENQPIESYVKPQLNEYPLKNEPKKPENITNPPIIQEISPRKNTSKIIDKIMIFYSDKTFMTFIPEE